MICALGVLGGFLSSMAVDNLVYELYGLTEEEIGIVEGY